MGQKSGPVKEPAEQVVKDIRRATRRQFSAEEKHSAVGPARRGQHRRVVPARGDRPEPLLPLVEGISAGWQTAPGGRHGAGGNFGRGQGSAPRGSALKEVVAELTLENRLLKKSAIGAGEDGA